MIDMVVHDDFDFESKGFEKWWLLSQPTNQPVMQTLGRRDMTKHSSMVWFSEFNEVQNSAAGMSTATFGWYLVRAHPHGRERENSAGPQ